MKVKKTSSSASFKRVGVSAGHDMCSVESIEIPLGKSSLVKTGIHLEIPHGYVGILTHRSSFPCKRGGHIVMGVIDEDYRGEVKLNVLNVGGEDPLCIRSGDKIAQMVIVKCLSVPIEFVDTLSDTSRGCGGFGSTDEIS